jgi:spore cortex protein
LLILAEEVFYLVLHRKFWPLSALVFLGLTGCGGNDETAVQDERTQETTPIGYYSNENHEGNGGNPLLGGADNDGPVTEIADHSLGMERETNKRFMRTENKNTPNNKQPLANRNINNTDSKTATIGGTDKNYHGHISNTNQRTFRSYYTGYEGKFAERVKSAAEEVDNVNQARTIVDGNDVVIALDIKNNQQTDDTKKQVLQAVQRHTEGRTVHIVTNESQFNRIKAIDNDLRNGQAREQLHLDTKNLIRSLNDQ